MSDAVWWEKTIEYRFLQEFFLEKGNICPLDGNEELVGDAITFINSKWSLIEFKKSSKELKTEKNKYKNYEKAKKKLVAQSDHHHFVYGDIKDHNFTLFQENYWGKGNSSSESVNIVSKVLDSGVKFNEFAKYILQLLLFKKQNSASSSTIFGSIGNSYVFLSSNNSDLFNFFFYYLKTKIHENGYKYSNLDYEIYAKVIELHSKLSKVQKKEMGDNEFEKLNDNVKKIKEKIREKMLELDSGTVENKFNKKFKI